MKNCVLILVTIFAIPLAHATGESYASFLVRDFSETIACQINDYDDDRKVLYKAVQLEEGAPDLNGIGSVFVVYWEGDVGCWGGNGTVTPNFTVVEHNGFASADPVVRLDYKFPDLDLVWVESLSVENEALIIEGVTYGPQDHQHAPTKGVTYILRLDMDNKEFKVQ